MVISTLLARGISYSQKYIYSRVNGKSRAYAILEVFNYATSVLYLFDRINFSHVMLSIKENFSFLYFLLLLVIVGDGCCFG